MAVLLPSGKQYYPGNDGLPLVGGQLFTYDIGTVNPRLTWADENQVNPNTNPIILDARGEASVFWSGDYTVVLLDALGNQIWSEDGVNTSAATLLDNYALDAGISNAYAATGIATSSLIAGMKVAIKINNPNSGNSTLNYDGLGPIQITWFGAPLPPGALEAGQIYQFEFDGISWQLLNGSLFGVTQQELNAGVLPINLFKDQGDLTRYGALYDGVTDGTAALVQACSVGGDIRITGPLVLASASLAALSNTAVTLLSNTTIRFINSGGSGPASITITGSTGCNLFFSFNQTNIRILDPMITGIGGSGVTTSTGYVWYCKADAAATADMYNCRIVGGRLTNFGGLYWLYFDNTAGTTYHQIGCGMNDTMCISQSGNCQGPSDINYTAAICAFSGSDTASYFGITDPTFYGNKVYGKYIKQGCIFWSGVARGKAYNNIFVSMGADASIMDDAGTYAVLVYDHSHGAALAPDLCEVYDNKIAGVRDCGIYGAVATRLSVRGNTINGQTSTANGTLPKGAIAVSNCPLSFVTDNQIDSCAFGITVVVGTGCEAIVTNNLISGVVTGTVGLLIQPTGTGSVGRVTVDGFKIIGNATSSANGLSFFSNSTIALQYLVIRNGEIENCYNALGTVSTDATVPAFGSVTMENIILRGSTNTGLSYQNCTNGTSHTSIINVEFQAPDLNSQDLVLVNSRNLNISGVRFRDRLTGSKQCWYGSGSQGTVANVQFQNVASARKVSASSDLGGALPTWAGNDNDYVQNLNPTELGGAGSMYCVLGWVYDVAGTVPGWKPCRTLTGN